MSPTSRYILVSKALVGILLACSMTAASATSSPRDTARISSNEPIIPFQACTDSIKSLCIMSVAAKGSPMSFAGNVASSPDDVRCDGKNLDGSRPGSASWCYRDSIPTFAADGSAFIAGHSPGFKVLIIKSPNAYRNEVAGTPSATTETYVTILQPVIVTRAGGPGNVPSRVATPSPYKSDDSWTISVNFGPVPPPNFYAQAEVNSYVTKIDTAGNTIVEFTIAPLELAHAPNGDNCSSLMAGSADLMIGLTFFKSALLESDPMRHTVSFRNGFAVASNSICAIGAFRIAEDGSMETEVAANHLKPDGSLYLGYFSAVVTPLALQDFNVSPDLVRRGGLNVIRSVNGNSEKIDSEAILQSDGSVFITARGFHYSMGSITVSRNPNVKLPSRTVEVSAAVGSLRVGRLAIASVTAPQATGRVHATLVGRNGQRWSLGSGTLSAGRTRIRFAVPKKFPRGNTTIDFWYEGSRSLRPSSTQLRVVIR